MPTSVQDYNALRMETFLKERLDGLQRRECAGVERGRMARAVRIARRWSNTSSSASEVPRYGITPSMSSVLSQVRLNRSRKRTDNYSDCASASYSSSGSASVGKHSLWSASYTLQGSSKMVREDSLGESLEEYRIGTGAVCGNDHPLGWDSEPSSVPSFTSAMEPSLRLVNPQDLVLQDEYCTHDIVQFYKPVYQRVPARRTSVDLTINTATNVGTAQVLGVGETTQRSSGRLSSLINESDIVELENWPHQSHHCDPDPTGAPAAALSGSPHLELPNRRTRQQTLNPNFLKLYALETSSKARNLIPDLNVDEQVLRKLSFGDIRALHIPPASQAHPVSAHDIKLALITRKKLWSEMMCEPRSDLHGDNAPWNLHFTASPHHTHSPQPASRSLVRVNSDIKPWTSLSSSLMLRPSGKLQLTRASAGRPSKELQYVVKGWCDSRFASSTH